LREVKGLTQCFDGRAPVPHRPAFSIMEIIMPRAGTKKTAGDGNAGGRGGVVSNANTTRGDAPSADPAPDASTRRGFRAKSSYLTPQERLERLAMTGWAPAWVADRWGITEAELAKWVAGTARQRIGFDRWLWRMSNVITAALPSSHPPRLKSPPVRLRDMARDCPRPVRTKR
jgi:hypothetical protein